MPGFYAGPRLSLLKPRGGALGEWVDAFGPYTSDGENGGALTLTIRQVVKAAQLSNTGKSQVRVTLQAANGEGLILGNVYIQTSAMAGDAYDFSAAPLELLFSGGSGFSISAGQSIVSDALAFTIPAATDLVVSMYFGSATDGWRSYSLGATGNRSYYKVANEPTTVDATGYSALADGTFGPIMRIESR